MADERLITQGLEALESLIGLVLEEALDQAVARPPDDPAERLRWLADLKQAGADVVTLAEAAAAVLRRWPDPYAGPNPLVPDLPDAAVGLRDEIPRSAIHDTSR